MATRINISTAAAYRPSDEIAHTKIAARRRLLGLVLMMIVSGCVFCLMVAYQRDARIRGQGEEWAKRVQERLQSYYSARSFLPPTLPHSDTVGSEPLLIPYPTPEEVMQLSSATAAFVVVASPRVGTILPGDGCAAVMFEGGKFRTAWLTEAEARAARVRRHQLVTGQSHVPPP
jgi:hypothetical protein